MTATIPALSYPKSRFREAHKVLNYNKLENNEAKRCNSKHNSRSPLLAKAQILSRISMYALISTTNYIPLNPPHQPSHPQTTIPSTSQLRISPNRSHHVSPALPSSVIPAISDIPGCAPPTGVVNRGIAFFILADFTKIGIIISSISRLVTKRRTGGGVVVGGVLSDCERGMFVMEVVGSLRVVEGCGRTWNVGVLPLLLGCALSRNSNA